MGTQSSTIPTLQIPITNLQPPSCTPPTKSPPPFRKYTNPQPHQSPSPSHHKITLSLTIEQPEPQHIEIEEEIYEDLEDAFDYKTKDVVLDAVLYDRDYVDREMFLGFKGGKGVLMGLRKFGRFGSYGFNNLVYEMHMNQLIQGLNCIYCNTIQDKYIIQTGLQAEGDEYPNTQVFVLEPAVTNLSQIVRYRRQNKWAWTTLQFNALVSDLVQGVSALHNANISHNDIRPSTVLYNLERNCYQLAGFGNAAKCPTKDMRGSRRSMNMSQARGSVFYGAPELSKTLQANFQQADIYSLGITLLCAFYLVQPLNLTQLPKHNKTYQKTSQILPILQQLIQVPQKRPDIATILKKIPAGQKSTKMKHLIQSLKYKNMPKGDDLIKMKKVLSEGYQRLGLWNQWKLHGSQAYQLQENGLDDFKKANSLAELAKIQSCRGDIIASSDLAKQASALYRNLGYTAYDQGNINQSLNLFTKAIECSKYFQTPNSMDTAKNLQGLALIHAQKSQYQISKPLINESSYIVLKNTGKESIEYCKIKMCEAKIESDFGQFEQADRILHDCVAICDKKMYENDQTVQKLKAQILHEIGRNAMLQSSYNPQTHQIMLTKAYKYLSQSLTMNQKLPNSYLQLASNYQTLGQIELRKQNYLGARMNFRKVEELRLIHDKVQVRSTVAREKEHAQILCNLAACQSGIENYGEAIKGYNQALEIYRKLYGSDHNKMSALAIGNMNKVYYKLNDIPRSKQCLKIATQILQDLLGPQDPDCQHFKHLHQTL